MENLVSLKIEQVTVDKILDNIAECKSLLPGLKTLTPKQRHECPKMGDASLPFVGKAKENCINNSNIAPPYLDITEFAIDVSDEAHLHTIETSVQQLLDAISDTRMLVGSEAYVAALMFYNSAKDAARHNIPGAKAIVDDLKKRFPGTKHNQEVTPQV
jgi:hypothetical protein